MANGQILGRNQEYIPAVPADWAVPPVNTTQALDELAALIPVAAVLANGSVAFAANESMGGFVLTNLAAPVAGGDATNKTYVDAGDAAAISTSEAFTTAA